MSKRKLQELSCRKVNSNGQLSDLKVQRCASQLLLQTRMAESQAYIDKRKDTSKWQASEYEGVSKRGVFLYK